jgi:PAS domain S-box-containing protein
LQSGLPVIVEDQLGLTHLAVPLSLGQANLGAIIAGQVFHRYPDPLALRRAARDFGVSAPLLWDVARKERPISGIILKASGELLHSLGHAFLRQRYGAILEARLADSNRRFRLMVETLTDHALFTMDLNGTVTSWNLGAERMTGYKEADIVGLHFSKMFTPEDVRDGIPERQLTLARHAGRAEDEGWRVRASGQRFWATVSKTALVEDAGPILGFAVMMHDVTDRRMTATALEEARQERERLQEKFLSHVSHELRTPLTAIYFFTTNVLDGLVGNLTPGQREHLTLALDNVKQLTDMVRDLLDITRVETHKIALAPQQVSADTLIAECLSTCGRNAVAKKIILRSEHSAEPPYLWADPTRVRQILTNLIENGIKFTPEGGTVIARSRPYPDDPGFLCLSVSDTGAGISSEHREIIFDRLAQVESGIEASRTGLGLGLFISKELVKQHGGKIWVESRLGQGSTFFFTLPIFSLAKLCAPIFIAPNLELGIVTLIAVDVTVIEGAFHADQLSEIRSVLKRCIHGGQDVLLPPMSNEEPAAHFFIVACTDGNGFRVIARRLERELRNFDSASKLTHVISSTTLHIASGEPTAEQIGEVIARIERLIQEHLADRKRLK